MTLSKIDAQYHKAIDEVLSVKSTTVTPQMVETDQCNFVFNMNHEWAVLNPIYYWPSPLAINGVATGRKVLLGPQGFQFSGISTELSHGERNSRLVSAWVGVLFNAAGAVAFNGKTLVVNVALANSTTSFPIIYQQITVVSGRLEYGIALDRPVPVPNVNGIVMSIESADGTVFPAATTMLNRAYAFTRHIGGMLPS